jgi:ATP-dependent Lon protease
VLIVIIGVDALLGQRARMQGFWEILEAAHPAECRAFFGLPPTATPYFILCAGPQPPPINSERIGQLKLAGYTSDEKRRILGLLATSSGLCISPEEQERLVHAYARDEPGLQSIVRLINAAAAEKSGEVTMAFARRHLGPASQSLFDQYREPMPGVCLAAAYTPSGGAEMVVEAARSEMPGLRVLGSAGPTMVESAHLALTTVNALLPASERLCRSGSGGVVVNFQGQANWKKDGSSAGLAVALSLMSLATERPLPPGLAATGEVSLTGRVLGVSKVPEKVLLWERNGVTRSLIPRANQQDLSALSSDLNATHQAHLVHNLADAFALCGLG